jgi:hypothetical protein
VRRVLLAASLVAPLPFVARTFLFAQVTAAPVAPVAAPAATASLDEVLAKARASTHVESFRRSGKDLVIDGTQTVTSVAGKWSCRVAADGRVASRFESRLGDRNGFDGRTTWRVDPSGMPSTQQFESREHALLVLGLNFGTWCLDGGPVVPVRLEPSRDAATTTLVVRARDGVLECALDLDAATALPKRLLWTTGRAKETHRWSDWRAEGEGGLVVAHEYDTDDEGEGSRLTIHHAELAAPADAATFAPPTLRPSDTTFDASAPSRVAGRLTFTRHLLVKAKVDGRDLDWFVFDSGAGASILSPKVAKDLGLDPFGEFWVAGAGASRQKGHFFEASQFTVGPATIAKPRFAELDLSGLETAFNVKLSGICGYDLLQRVVAVVDMESGAIDLFDPAKFARDGVTWRPLTLHGNHAHVRCTFDHDGEEEGVFRLDTGAPGVGVIFHSPFVKSMKLLEGRDTQPFNGLAGVGGQASARIGELAWFEVGGVTIDAPQVVFSTDDQGALADPWTAGTVGGRFLERFDLIFDYPHDRVGFVPHQEPK